MRVSHLASENGLTSSRAIEMLNQVSNKGYSHHSNLVDDEDARLVELMAKAELDTSFSVEEALKKETPFKGMPWEGMPWDYSLGHKTEGFQEWRRKNPVAWHQFNKYKNARMDEEQFISINSRRMNNERSR